MGGIYLTWPELISAGCAVLSVGILLGGLAFQWGYTSVARKQRRQ